MDLKPLRKWELLFISAESVLSKKKTKVILALWTLESCNPDLTVEKGTVFSRCQGGVRCRSFKEEVFFLRSIRKEPD